NFGNRILAGLYRPQHMIHDAIVPAGTPAVLVGKFDYDRVLHKDLEKEYVHAYVYGTGMQGWQYLGRYTTDTDGKIRVPVNKGVGEYRVRMVVEGDRSSVDGFLSVVEPGRQAVLFDIDGTLTLTDFEAYADYLGIRTAQAYAYAPETVNAYRAKGYQIIYLTARPYWVTQDARSWFPKYGLLDGHYHSNPFGDGPVPPDTQAFKTDYVKYLREQVGLDIIRAYGNASTDIAAYADGGIPKAETWIIGSNAGASGTQALYDDYTYHFSTVVMETPTASCN
ncbi:MAG: haloacid dehalogenase, partial [Gammaproteobacteria bacterium]|nr:haloacid dehalogenase [Gammaproteobacteria bacterium]